MIRVQTPTRIDLAGGTLDLYPLHQFVYPESFTTLNIAINIYNTVEISKLFKSKIIVASMDINLSAEFDDLNHLFNEIRNKTNPLMLAMKAIYYFGIEGIMVNLSSKAPKGSGLGNSSSLLIAIIGGLNIVAESKYSPEQMIEIAQGIETSILKIPTGIQDYIASMYGGINSISHTLVKREINRINDSKLFETFVNNAILCYVGEPKRFSKNLENPNWHIFRNVVEQKDQILENLVEINKIVNLMNKAIDDNDWRNLILCINEETRIRSKLTETIVSNEIEKLVKILETKEIEGYKICGAGGGGCVLIFSQQTEALKMDLRSMKYDILDFSIDWNGFQVKK